MREELLALVSKRGILLEPEAIDYLLLQSDPIGPLDRYLTSCPVVPFVVTLRDIMRAESLGLSAAIRTRPADPAPEKRPSASTPSSTSPASVPSSFRRQGERASEHAPDVTILRDITGRSTCEGTLEDFTRYFRNRFQVLSQMLRGRRELVGTQEISKARRSTHEVRFIGMVSDVRATKNGHRVLELEDEMDHISVLIPADSPAAPETYMMDEVVGIVGKVNDRGLAIAGTVVRPDIPVAKPFHGIGEHIRAAFISDIHVGSTAFLDEKWAKFTAWMSSDDEVARSLRYLVVSGDVVDGIGVYPRQDEELSIDDIYGQYEALARMMTALPDHVTVVMIPGNHDAVRPAEPQPALPQPIQKLFDSNLVFAGNPSLVSLHGIKVLAYHGRSMDDFVSAIPGMNYHRPLDAMREMLKMRHLAPIYGGKTPIAPEAEDHLVIEEVPDIFATGHVHGVGVDVYRGVILLNSSTWQAQTSYQKMRNIEPIPARLPVVDLATGQAVIKEF
jgi:DNA polymerase II small subunit